MNLSLLDEGSGMNKYLAEKKIFALKLADFAGSLATHITKDDAWTVKGFVDVLKNIYTISTDTKIISKILELHLMPHFLTFAKKMNYRVELATFQNWYPDLTFISKENPDVKFAVDIKTTYHDETHAGFCNGFTLGSHGEYFVNRDSSKNIQYPYKMYSGHFCLGIIYTRSKLSFSDETKSYSFDELEKIPSVIRNLTFFAQEKWKIASDKGGSGNTANIGSINKIEDILAGNGTFAKAGEQYFDEYWANFGKIKITNKDGSIKSLSSFAEYLAYRGLPEKLYNPKAKKKKGG